MNILDFKNELQNLVKGKILVDEPLSLYTTWKIGGPADVVFMPASTEEIAVALKLARKYSIPFYVMGNGSNVLVKDGGFRGIVIKTVSGNKQVLIEGTRLKVDGGTMMPIVARVAADNGLTGLEFAVGIPASVGGATVMNAGAHGSCMADVVKTVTVLDLDGEIKTFDGFEAGFGYRSSRLKDARYIVSEVDFSLQEGSPVEIKNKMSEFLIKRKEIQPNGKPNAGSVFQNPAGHSAGKLIDEAGCKGLTVGGATVSEKHANFILNNAHATASDVLVLIDKVKKIVYQKFNIDLALEIQVIGE